MTNYGQLKYYCDADGVKITISVNNLRMGRNNSQIVLIVGYIGPKTLRINPKARLVVK